MASVVPLHQPPSKRQPPIQFFDRQDLGILLNLYSTRVAKAEWRDYAIGHDPGLAHFSVFRHAHETPLFTITKRQVSGRPLYAVYAGERKLRQGADLRDVLKVFDKAVRLLK
jgi:hypothetical protein